MGLIVRTHGVASGHQEAERVKMAAAAAALIAADNAGRLPHVEIAVTHFSGMHRLADMAEARVVGGGQCSRPAEARYGRAALAPRGVLIAINAAAHHGNPRELGATLVHELVHAAQLNRPGARNRHIAYLRNNYGIEKMTVAAARKANLQIARDEDEARQMEGIALKLMPALTIQGDMGRAPWRGRMQVRMLNDKQVRAIEHRCWADAHRMFRLGEHRRGVDKWKARILKGDVEPIHLGISARYPEDVYVRDGHHRAVAFMELSEQGLGESHFPFVWSWIKSSGGTKPLPDPFPYDTTQLN